MQEPTYTAEAFTRDFRFMCESAIALPGPHKGKRAGIAAFADSLLGALLGGGGEGKRHFGWKGKSLALTERGCEGSASSLRPDSLLLVVAAIAAPRSTY